MGIKFKSNKWKTYTVKNQKLEITAMIMAVMIEVATEAEVATEETEVASEEEVEGEIEVEIEEEASEVAMVEVDNLNYSMPMMLTTMMKTSSPSRLEDLTTE